MNKPESSADLILHRGLFTTLARSQPTATVYSYPPPSPEPVRSDPHGVLARARRRIDGADRTGPGSRPDAVDHEIEAWFLDQQQASWHCDPEPTSTFGRPVFRCQHDARERAC